MLSASPNGNHLNRIWGNKLCIYTSRANSKIIEIKFRNVAVLNVHFTVDTITHPVDSFNHPGSRSHPGYFKLVRSVATEKSIAAVKRSSQ